MDNTKFSLTFYGEGWPKEDALPEPTGPPTKKLITNVTSTNTGYSITGVAVLLCATTILKEKSKMPGTGGVLPPGAAFAKTSLIDELCKNGFTFEVISGKESTKDE